MAFRVPIGITRSVYIVYINAPIGATFAVVFGMLGILLGEILRVLWTGVYPVG